MTRPVPHDPEVEKALLGAALLNRAVVEHLDPADFYDPRNRMIAEAIIRSVAAGDTTHPLHVPNHAPPDANLTARELVDLESDWGTLAWDVHARRLRQLRIHRELLVVARELRDQVIDGRNEDLPALIAQFRRRLSEISRLTG